MLPRSLIAACTLLLAACSPALNWREVRPADAGLVLLFPCKPAHQTRSVLLAGATVEMTLHACQADGAVYAVAQADTGDPARVGPALRELREAIVRNVDGQTRTLGSATAKGATPNEQAQRIEVLGTRADGSPVQEQAAFFAKGTRVFQAVVVGARLKNEALDTFFGNLSLP